MRVYLPATLSTLATALDTGVVAASGARALAVTGSLRAAFEAPSDDETLEHVVQTAAADGSVALLRADGDAAPRRVVLALEVDDAQVDEAQVDQAEAGQVDETETGAGRLDPAAPDTAALAAVTLREQVPVRRLASALVDDVAAAQAVRAVIEAGAVGDEVLTGQDVSAGLDDHDLLWFAVQELPDLVAAG